MDVITKTIISELKLLKNCWLKTWMCEEKINIEIMKLIILELNKAINKYGLINKNDIESYFALSCVKVLYDLTIERMEWNVFKEKWRKRFVHNYKNYDCDNFFYIITLYIDREKIKNNNFISNSTT